MAIIAIDIGNTNISCSVVSQGNVFFVKHIGTSLFARQKRAQLKSFLKRHNQYKAERAPRVVICSVVPAALDEVKKIVKEVLGTQPLVIGRDVIVPVKNNYKNPRQVGQDRLVGAYAAKKLYGHPCIIIDLGTAITFDVVSAKGEYEGGLIVPGIQLSVESLFQKTAMLPRVDKIQIPQQLIGRDTRTSILSGIFNGYGALCNGLIDQISKGMKGRPNVIITGGHTELMRKFVASKILKVDKYLVFKGLELLSRYHHSRR
jgi:type III pantothenate kinase